MKFIKMKWSEALDKSKVLDCRFEKKSSDITASFLTKKSYCGVIAMHDAIMRLISTNEKIRF